MRPPTQQHSSLVGEVNERLAAAVTGPLLTPVIDTSAAPVDPRSSLTGGAGLPGGEVPPWRTGPAWEDSRHMQHWNSSGEDSYLAPFMSATGQRHRVKMQRCISGLVHCWYHPSVSSAVTCFAGEGGHFQERLYPQRTYWVPPRHVPGDPSWPAEAPRRCRRYHEGDWDRPHSRERSSGPSRGGSDSDWDWEMQQEAEWQRRPSGRQKASASILIKVVLFEECTGQ